MRLGQFVLNNRNVLSGAVLLTAVVERAFDIYASREGYVAVTNPVRRRILEALAEAPRQLPELMEITGRSKPTLSSVHMRELLGQGVIREEPHPKDARRKVYHLTARRIGSSDIPVEELRSAVKHSTATASSGAQVPLFLALRALAAGPASMPGATVHAQAVGLGEGISDLVPDGRPGERLVALARLLEANGLARPLQIDLEHGRLVLEPSLNAGEGLGDHLAAILAGLTEGLLAGGDRRVRVEGAVEGPTKATLRFHFD